MPIKDAAKKYMRVTARKTLRNKAVTGVYRNAMKKTYAAVASGNLEEAHVSLKASLKALDKASQKGVVKKNTAARTKSRLNAFVKKAVLAKK